MNTSGVHCVDAVLPPAQIFLIGQQHVQGMYALSQRSRNACKPPNYISPRGSRLQARP